MKYSNIAEFHTIEEVKNNPTQSLERIEKSYKAGNISEGEFIKATTIAIEILEKGKGAQIGEIREWSGKKYQKQSDKSWKPVKKDSKKVSKDTKSSSDFYNQINHKYGTDFKPGDIEEFEDPDMRSQLTQEDIKAIVDVESKDSLNKQYTEAITQAGEYIASFKADPSKYDPDTASMFRDRAKKLGQSLGIDNAKIDETISTSVEAHDQANQKGE